MKNFDMHIHSRNKGIDPARDRLYETALCGHSCHVPEAGNMLADAALALADRLHKEYTK